jgi:hypothetical protein
MRHHPPGPGEKRKEKKKKRKREKTGPNTAGARLIS